MRIKQNECNDPLLSQFKPVQQSKHQVLRAYCPNIYTVVKGEIGGRLKTIDIAGRNYECGGSIIHPKNLLMKKLVEEMGLSPTDGMHFLIFHC